MNFDFDGYRRTRGWILTLKNTATRFVIFVDCIEFSVTEIRSDEQWHDESTKCSQESFH